MRTLTALACAVWLLPIEPSTRPHRDDDLRELYVDPSAGKDDAGGTKRRPLKSLAAALALLPDPLRHSVTVHLAPGAYETTGDGESMPEESLQLMHRMRPRVDVRFVGPGGDEPAIFAWAGERMIEITEGIWRFERLQVGTFQASQRRGIAVEGAGQAIVEDVTFRLRSHSDVGLRATRGGHIRLRGRIRLNEHLHEETEEETFCGLLADDHGVIEFDQRDGSSLELGNGSLSVRTYGRIRLGCEEAEVTCWTDSNNLTISDSGRIELAATPTTLRAKRRKNTPIGLEHDGHLLAEDAHVRIIGPNDSAIALQKSSTFTCNDIELVGEFENALWARSGSMFVGRFLGDVPKLQAKTGAMILVEEIGGELTGDLVVESGGLISVPGRVER